MTSSPLPYGSAGSIAGSVAGTPGSTPHPRSDIGTPGRFREVDLGSAGGRTSVDESRSSTDGVNTTSEGGHHLNRTVIWGTDVNIKDTKDRFKAFFNTYIEADTGLAKYPRILEQVHEQNEFYLDLDCRDLRDADMALYDQLIRYPQEVIPVFDMVLQEKYVEMFRADPEAPLQVRTHSLDGVSTMRDLNPEGKPAWQRDG